MNRLVPAAAGWFSGLPVWAGGHFFIDICRDFFQNF
jgi:hypothetical protein